MENVTLLAKDRFKIIEGNMVINDMKNNVEIILTTDYFHVQAIDEFAFSALAKVRLELESKGYFILVNGSRYNVYPSGMQYDTFCAYELELGKPATNTICIFDKITNIVEVTTVEEQEKYFHKWIKSIGG